MTAKAQDGAVRCPWASNDIEYRRYHDEEWGVPLTTDDALFEKLVLEGFQAGLSWLTILRKRENFRRAFARFDAGRIARFGKRDVERLLKDEGIIRNRAKIRSAIENARAFLKVRKEFGTFDRYIWGFARKEKTGRRARHFRELPVTSPEAEAMSQDLRRRGFSFVGPTICYAFMQACGMVDDHLHGCFRIRADR